MQGCHYILKVSFTAFIGSFFFICALTLLLIGGLDLQEKYPQVKYYANSMCRVYASDHKTYQCSTKYKTYTCYGPTWDVYYGLNETIFAEVETERRYPTIHEAFQKTKEYQIGECYSCWYDTRHPSQARWDQPSDIPEIVLVSCGGASALLCILSFYVTYLLVKKEKYSKS